MYARTKKNKNTLKIINGNFETMRQKTYCRLFNKKMFLIINSINPQEFVVEVLNHPVEFSDETIAKN